MPNKNNIKCFKEYFSGVKWRVPVYEDGSSGRPEVMGRFTTLKNEEEMEEYEVTKKEQKPEEQNKQSISTEINEGGYF